MSSATLGSFQNYSRERACISHQSIILDTIFDACVWVCYKFDACCACMSMWLNASIVRLIIKMNTNGTNIEEIASDVL